MSRADESPRFERVDWSSIDGSRRLLGPERLALVAGVAVLVATFLYDSYVAHVYIASDWQMNRIDWLFLFGCVVLVAYVAVPAARNPGRTRRVLRRLGSRRTYAVAAGLLAVFVAVGLLGPALLGSAPLRYAHSWHPPLGFSIQKSVVGDCLGQVTETETIARNCHGTLTEYPLGANHQGRAMDWLIARGARTALYVVVFTAVFVVPVSVAVGVIAGLRGGLVDDLLMGYVDVQLSIPAIIVYFIGYMYWNPSLLLLLVTFGLLSWGPVARLVRSEVLQRREAGYVMVARSLGAPTSYLARRHVLPNITNTVVPSVFQLFALLVLVEAGVAFLGFQDPDLHSWGSTIATGVDPTFTVAGTGTTVDPHEYWWVSTLPALALSSTLVAFKLLGDGLRDALDPRAEH